MVLVAFEVDAEVGSPGLAGDAGVVISSSHGGYDGIEGNILSGLYIAQYKNRIYIL